MQELYGGKELGMFKTHLLAARVAIAQGKRGDGQEVSWRRKAKARPQRPQEEMWVLF